MNYTALYRKYRPETFDGVIGQDHIVATLKNQIVNGKVSHAYLFTGTRGTGKTSTAKIFARAINCIDSKDGNPCLKCSVCRQLQGNSIDIVGNWSAACQQRCGLRKGYTRKRYSFLPFRANTKFTSSTKCTCSARERSNALLKTLEETSRTRSVYSVHNGGTQDTIAPF